MRTETAATWQARIYMSGPLDVAKQAIRQYCLAHGCCVSIEPTTFIYTGGEEAGFVVGLLNYPRFPASEPVLVGTARALLALLLDATCQHSGLLVMPDQTEWVSKRESV